MQKEHHQNIIQQLKCYIYGSEEVFMWIAAQLLQPGVARPTHVKDRQGLHFADPICFSFIFYYYCNIIDFHSKIQV